MQSVRSQMQQLLKAMGQQDLPDIQPILEINPDHEIITKLQGAEDDEVIADVAELLLDQALIVEGAQINEPVEFVRRLNRVLGRSL